MKKAFDANVSRARPRLRFGAAGSLGAPEPQSLEGVEAIAAQVAREEVHLAPSVTDELSQVVKARAAAHARRATAEELLHEALADQDTSARAPVPVPVPVTTPTPVAAEATGVESFPAHESAWGTVAQAEPPPEVVEVQTPPPPEPVVDQGARRERLKSRLRAVRENPRPEPLPDTVAAAGHLAVERISTLQSELTKAREHNLTLTQDLEAARRQAERATEEARLRMDEAKRLAAEMETRAALLTELEQELEALEAERNEALIAVQDSRLRSEGQEKEKLELTQALAAKDQEVDECLAEEERLAAELQATRQTAATLRRSTEVLTQERDTLARQVTDLTRERTELLEARRALEAVHRALSSATLR
jgi:hypothetical protein